MMKTTDFGSGDDPAGRWADRPAIRCILVQPEVGPAPMVVGEVRAKDTAEMWAVDDDHVIQTLAANRADQALDVRALPRTHGTGHDFRDPYACHAATEDV